MTRLIFLVLFCCLFCNYSYGQTGYVILKNDSILTGFVKAEISKVFPEYGKLIKVYKRPTDKKPATFYEKDIKEYSVKKDTILILQGFTTEDGMTLPFIPVKLIERGGYLSLYSAIEIVSTPGYYTPQVGQTIMGVTNTTMMHNAIAMNSGFYILHHHGINYKKRISIDKTEVMQDLEEFIEDKSFMDVTRSKKLNYRDLPELVKNYNKVAENVVAKPVIEDNKF